MKVGCRRPAELRRARRTLGQISVELRPVALRQRQPEKRAEPYAFLAQCVGAHAPGALGLKPNCELTESMPAARLSTWLILTSSGVIAGLVDSVSIAMAAGSISSTGTLSFGFLIPRAWRNQSKLVSYFAPSGPPSSMILPSSSGLEIASTMQRAASARRMGCIRA